MIDTLRSRRAVVAGFHSLSLLAALAAVVDARAQTGPSVTALETVVISGRRIREPSFDVPAAISAVNRDAIESAGPQVSLAEVLNRVPGISVLNRNNEAQDLQLSIRGFGARSTFGIRGVKVLVDGIPATMPDGQGQVSNVSLGSVGRIEVLRGPLAQLYGNAAGGVVRIVTQDDALVPTATVTAARGRFGLRKIGVKASTSTPGYGLTIEGAESRTDGFRPHSESKRRQLNARWQAQASDDTRLAVVLNALDQPLSKDPLGLTATQFRSRDRGSQPAYLAALAQDPRKTVRQEQLGATLEHRLGEATELSASLYVGSRRLANALSVPIAAQASATSSGGIVDFDRTYGGGTLQGSHRVALGDGRYLKLNAGVEMETYREDRQGYVNTRGQRGDLKRDEVNTVSQHGCLHAGGVRPDPTVDADRRRAAQRCQIQVRRPFHHRRQPGRQRSTQLRCDQSGRGPGAGRRRLPLNLYANVGRGFETPTFNELSYRSSGLTGLNTALKASRSRHAEIGGKWKIADAQRLDVALFDIRTDDEIVVDTNSGGRSTFRNAGRTSRRGFEVAHEAPAGRHFAQRRQPDRTAGTLRRQLHQWLGQPPPCPCALATACRAPLIDSCMPNWPGHRPKPGAASPAPLRSCTPAGCT